MESEDTQTLRYAADNGDVALAQRLLDQGEDINYIERDNLTPLAVACIRGHTELARLLLNRGATQYVELHRAARSGQLEIVELLLDHGADSAKAAMWPAMYGNHINVLKLLLSRGVEPELSNRDTSLLTEACKLGHIATVKVLLDSGALLEPKGVTPLMMAAHGGHEEVVNELLARGSNVNAEYDSTVVYGSDWGDVGRLMRGPGTTALAEACDKGHLSVMKLLLSAGATLDSKGPLVRAASGGFVDVVKELLDRGLHINEPYNGLTPLHAASYCATAQMMKFLLEQGANVDTKCSTIPPLCGKSCLYLAAANKKFDNVSVLLNAGATLDPKAGRKILKGSLAHNRQDVAEQLIRKWPQFVVEEPRTAIIAALNESSESDDILKLLLELGAKIHYTYRTVSPLGAAAVRARLSTVKLLLEHGADLNKGEPLEGAAKFEHFDVVHILLNAGMTMDTNTGRLILKQCLKNNRMDVAAFLIRNRPQYVAEDPKAVYIATKSEISGSIHILKLLLEHGAQIDWMGQRSRQLTALHYAVETKQVDKVRLLVSHGADATIPMLVDMFETTTVWDMCDKGSDTYNALLHFWTPQNHKSYPRHTKEAIVCTLMVAKQQQWPFDKLIMWKILSCVAFGWYQFTKPPS